LRWLQAKTDGLFGEIAPATAADYRSCIERHLLPIFGDCALEEIDRARCLRLKARLLSDARELREALTAGREMRDERRRPLGPASARKVLTALGAILDDAVEDDLIESNPARGKRMRVRVPKPNRTFLEMDELALLLDAAGIQDRLPQDVRLPQEPVWGAFIRSGALAASVRAARSRLKPTLACSPRVPSRAGNDRPRESGKTAAFESPI
jgi:hypothetical protein